MESDKPLDGTGQPIRFGRKPRAWWPFFPVEGREGYDRRVNARRIIPGGRVDVVGIFVVGHPALDGTRNTPRHKKRTIDHNKGTLFPGMSTVPPKELAKRNR